MVDRERRERNGHEDPQGSAASQRPSRQPAEVWQTRTRRGAKTVSLAGTGAWHEETVFSRRTHSTTNFTCIKDGGHWPLARLFTAAERSQAAPMFTSQAPRYGSIFDKVKRPDHTDDNLRRMVHSLLFFFLLLMACRQPQLRAQRNIIYLSFRCGAVCLPAQSRRRHGYGHVDRFRDESTCCGGTVTSS